MGAYQRHHELSRRVPVVPFDPRDAPHEPQRDAVDVELGAAGGNSVGNLVDEHPGEQGNGRKYGSQPVSAGRVARYICGEPRSSQEVRDDGGEGEQAPVGPDLDSRQAAQLQAVLQRCGLLLRRDVHLI